ncbi:hypothetical protein [Parasitella parasitica]|uniref:3-oxo-5-alpha-steroid 4-dehydrogenase C-terminal domain-containing protein n=1 Tax=Parasitella parasitica TaxID=35722 RepID=A0A0B7NCU9_9FUNG|nr:hypothetical protein [Parasitella parasitica]
MEDTIRRYWLKPSTYNTAVGIYATLPFLMLPALLVVNAPYGRFAGKLGIDWSLSGKWSWALMEVISPITFTSSLIFTRPIGTPFQIMLSAAWIVHYVNRSVIYPLRAASMAPIHILAFASSILFNILNGYTNGIWVGRHSNAADAQFWTGMLLWALGFASNVYHDGILFRLRQKSKSEDKQSAARYFIPHGGLFEYVSCPNYFSETMEWLGYALATHSSVPAAIFAIATAANLFPRAWRTHQWYRNQFNGAYPQHRKAVIPFLL